MKKTFLLFSLLIFCCNSMVNAQEWFPIGANWKYKVISPFASPSADRIETVYCKGDTLINGVNAKILVGGNTMCAFVIKNENYLYDHEISVGLRCYESPYFNYYAKPEYEIYGCDYKVNITENLQTNSITVFPNPVKDAVTLQIKEDNMHFPIFFILFDVLGNKIIEGQISNSYFSINLSSLPKGVYFLKLKNIRINETYKLIKV